jgi:hypothetical protein
MTTLAQIENSLSSITDIVIVEILPNSFIIRSSVSKNEPDFMNVLLDRTIEIREKLLYDFNIDDVEGGVPSIRSETVYQDITFSGK